MAHLWAERLRQYLTDPYTEWGDGASNHPKKLATALARSGADRAQTAQQVTALAHARRRQRPPTVFLPNCGSSGSHWLTTLLDELGWFADCGEVYFPPDLLSQMRAWDQDDRRALLDGVHLAHAPQGPETPPGTILINSAHTSGWRLARACGDTARLVLLVRDPLDITLSRTFRKPQYRERVAPDQSDEEYLETNIAFVQRFFRQAADNPRDLLVRYEDVRDDPEGTLAAVCRAVGTPVDADALHQAAARHGLYSDSTNSYRGPRHEPPEALVDRARRALETERKAWEYL